MFTIIFTQGSGKGGSKKDNFLYFYHPDHLGSTQYVTDSDGQVYEHNEYFPFGETWVEEASNTERTPYLFTSKELDRETGLYYYGSRYYDPRTSVWQSPDPILGSYLAGKPNGGVFNFKNLNLYSYTFLNPVKYIDPDGRKVEIGYTYVVNRLGIKAYHTLLILTDEKTREVTVLEAFPENKLRGGVSASVTSSSGASGGSVSGGSASGVSGAVAGGALQEGFGKLKKAKYSKRESEQRSKSKDIVHKEIVKPPKGMSDKQFRRKLSEQSDKYKNDKKYRPVPWGNSANSNSYTFSLLRGSGKINKTPSRWSPGWEKSIYSKKNN